MKIHIRFSILAALMLVSATWGFAQQPDISFMRTYDQNGTGIFEAPKSEDFNFDFEGLKVRLGGAFTQQFQALEHSNTLIDLDGDGAFDNPLYALEPGFNLATANLNIDVQLAEGVRLNLITYLSSRHHPEAWVKGGFIQLDAMPFLNSDWVDNIMENVRIKVGHMEINYGDAHFRRTDNGNAIYNPFVGNYIVDAFNTEIGAEFYYLKEPFTAMLGITGGEINGNVTEARTSDVDDNAKRSPSIIGKLAYDSQVNDDVRLRLSTSVYRTASSSVNHLYSGDRGGSRYYLVMVAPGVGAGDRGVFPSGRYNPGFVDEVTSFMGNVFLKVKGLELFGTYESSAGRNWFEAENRNMNQFAAEALYRFGESQDVYLGARYNTVSADDPSGEEISINRYQLGAGWFLTKNILLKGEYVNQDYMDFPTGTQLFEGNFNGFILEAVVGF